VEGSVDESSEPGDSFLADVCREWEGATQPAEDAGIRVIHLRTGVVLDPRGGILDRLLPLFGINNGEAAHSQCNRAVGKITLIIRSPIGDNVCHLLKYFLRNWPAIQIPYAYNTAHNSSLIIKASSSTRKGPYTTQLSA